MDILVTGGAGFIGGHIARGLAGEGHAVTVLDNLEPYYDVGIKEHNIEAIDAAARTGGGTATSVNGSIIDTDLVDALVDDVDIIYHQAAQAGVRKSVEEPAKVNRYNVTGTLRVLEAARHADIDRVVVASSSSVYGTPVYLPYDEAHPTTPVSPYGVSKLATEQYARVYADLYDLPTVSLRYFTVYGPHMRPNMAISNFVSRCMHGESPVIYGDGTKTRDFTYVEDVVRVNTQLVDDDRADGAILNIGSTDTIDVLTLAETVRDIIDPTLEIEFAPPRQAEAEHTHADVTKAGELLDYEPTVGIREGVERFVAWYRENMDWYDPLVRQS